MRICSPQLGIDPGSDLGGAVYDRELLRAMAELGAKIDIILRPQSPYAPAQNWQIHFCKLKPLPIPHIGTYLYNLSFLPALFSISRQTKFDLLRIHTPYYLGMGGLLFAKIKKIPVVSHYHHLENNRAFKAIDKLIIKKFDKIITISNFSRRQMCKKYNMNNEKVDVVYPGISSKYVPTEKSRKLIHRHSLDSKKILLSMGQLIPRKNLLFLIKVFKEIHKTDPDVILMICSKGQQEAELKEFTRKIGLVNKIIFTGYISEQEKVDYYNLADIFVFPSLLEGFGLVAGEAMSCAKPVVASDAASIPEVVQDTVTGFLADPTDIDAFAEKILILLKNEQLRHQFGLNARRRVDQMFRWNIAAKQTLEAYSAVVSSR